MYDTMPVMNTKIIIIGLVVVIMAIFGYQFFITEPSFLKQESVKVNPTSPLSSKLNTIYLEYTGITFELPEGYAAYQREGFEGGYRTTVSIGKEISPGYFKYAALEIEVSPYIHDWRTDKDYAPEEYVDVVYEYENKRLGAKYIKLFGNKAVQYAMDSDGSMPIVGYIKANQSKLELKQGLGVEISFSTYGSGVGSNQELIDTVVNSLRIEN